MTLSKTKINIGCDKNAKDDKTCLTVNEKISVTTETTNIENSPLVYKYTVSIGKIIGEGKQVIWDLSGVSSGNYTITAAIDDGCGVCAAPKTETIIIK